MLTDHEFKIKVASMRAHQKAFFASHDSRELESSKRAEKEVDIYLQQYFEPALSL